MSDVGEEQRYPSEKVSATSVTSVTLVPFDEDIGVSSMRLLIVGTSFVVCSHDTKETIVSAAIAAKKCLQFIILCISVRRKILRDGFIS